MVLLGVLYFLLPAIQIAFYFTGQAALEVTDAVNFICSITALHWILANVLISTKVPWMQKHIPYDKRIRAHIIFSIGIILFVLFHSVHKLLLGYNIDLVTILLSFTLITLYLITILWVPIPGFASLRSGILKKIGLRRVSDYELYKSLHRILLSVLGPVVSLHVMLAGFFYDLNPISLILYLSLFILSYGLFFLSMTGFLNKTARVLRVTQTEDILSLYLKMDKKLRYRSGQFTFLGLKTRQGRIEEHPFSFLSFERSDSSQPQSWTDDLPSDVVSLGIRIVGDFTEELSLLKERDKVWLKGAFGNFHPQENSPICLIGSGIGLVPLISIVKDLYHRHDIRPILFFMAVNRRQEIPELNTLLKIDSEMGNLILYFLVYEEDQTLFSREYFMENLPNPQEYQYQICSSPTVRKIVFKAIESLGVKKTALHYEAYTFK